MCFKVAEGHWVAVDCLPERSAVASREDEIWRGAVPDAIATLHYAFLHEGVKRALLCALGKVAGPHAVYWRHGVCLYDARKKVTLRIDCRQGASPAQLQAGDIVIEVCGPNARACASELLRSISRGIRIGSEPVVTWAAGQGAEPAAPEREAGHGSHDKDRLFAQLQPAAPPLTATGSLPVIHVSYAWGGASENLVNALEQKLERCCTVRRDRSVMRAGDWISNFIAEIGLSRCVLTVISAKYLKSSYCMRELLYLYQTSLGDKAMLLGRIVPIVMPDAAIDTLAQRLNHAVYWKQQSVQLDEARQHLDDLSQGEATRRERLLIADFQHHVVDMLTWVADVLMPRCQPGTDVLDSDAVVAVIHKRLSVAE